MELNVLDVEEHNRLLEGLPNCWRIDRMLAMKRDAPADMSEPGALLVAANLKSAAGDGPLLDISTAYLSYLSLLPLCYMDLGITKI